MRLLRTVQSAAALGAVALVGFLVLSNMDGEGAVPPVDNRTEAERIVVAERVWREWMAQHGVTRATLAVGRAGEVLHGAGIGRNADDPAPIADLSAAVTAVCLNRIFDDRALSFNITLGELREAMTAIRVLPPLWAQEVTVAQLATHTSGLAPDVTRGEIWSRVEGSAPRHRRIALAALAQTAMTGTPGEFFYNLGNYAVLGAVIEALSGEDYARVCTREALVPAGVRSAGPGGAYAANSAFGGWALSASDLVRFAMHWTTADRTWMEYPASYPHAALGPDADYTLGLVRQGTEGEMRFEGLGTYCLGGPEDPEVGAGLVVLPGGWAAAATWNICTTEADGRALLSALLDALH